MTGLARRLGVLGLVAAAAAGPASAGLPASAGPWTRGCARTFSLAMGQRAARGVYRRGAARVLTAQRQMLTRVWRCQRRWADRRRVRALIGRLRSWWVTEHALAPGVASWFWDAGPTACGFHVGLGVANRWLACGTRVLFKFRGREAVGVVEDRGPFVAGRDWDFNQGLRARLGFDGVGVVSWAVWR